VRCILVIFFDPSWHFARGRNHAWIFLVASFLAAAPAVAAHDLRVLVTGIENDRGENAAAGNGIGTLTATDAGRGRGAEHDHLRSAARADFPRRLRS
jgi:hypothetical protein